VGLNDGIDEAAVGCDARTGEAVAELFDLLLGDFPAAVADLPRLPSSPEEFWKNLSTRAQFPDVSSNRGGEQQSG
jgi:hypothetical protein